MNTQTHRSSEENMPSDTTSDQRRAAKQQQVGAPPPEPEHLRCPRCDSTNTKFCYYNNYNFSQPRHFCKSCRRYWTHGGTLRDIPVGGGSRKNAKRSRTIPSSSSSSASSGGGGAHAFSAAISAHDFRHVPVTAPSSFLFPLGSDHGGPVPFHNEMVKPGLNVCGSFTSLLNTQGPGLLALGGFGLGVGVGPGMDEMGYGFGRSVWPFPGVAEGGANGGGPAMFSGGTWQLGSGENGFVNGDCFGFPDLAISTQGNGMK